LLNQADTPELQSKARLIAGSLLPVFDSAIIASLQAKTIHAVHESSAGVILAAGAATRFGKPKQLLAWNGEPLVRSVALTALQAGLSPVVVVTGAAAAEVEACVHELPVTLARNERWQDGQASSLQRGIAACPPATGSAVFLLADQPHVTTEIIRALVETHATGLHRIVAPLIQEERRGNPVLFDRETFADLQGLRGDVGGRAIFSKHRVHFLPWHDARLLTEIDTQEDYQRLLEGNRE
jgi:molybdenum cofactor cytidylyltransferase